MPGQLSAERCYSCSCAGASGLVAEYEGIPFGRLCPDCASSLGSRDQFLGAVFTAFPHHDGQVRLSVSAQHPLPAETRRLLEEAIREVVAARGLDRGAHPA